MGTRTARAILSGGARAEPVRQSKLSQPACLSVRLSVCLLGAAASAIEQRFASYIGQKSGDQGKQRHEQRAFERERRVAREANLNWRLFSIRPQLPSMMPVGGGGKQELAKRPNHLIVPAGRSDCAPTSTRLLSERACSRAPKTREGGGGLRGLVGSRKEARARER